MAKIIKFKVPTSFHKEPTKWIPPEQRGRVILFALDVERFRDKTQQFVNAHENDPVIHKQCFNEPLSDLSPAHRADPTNAKTRGSAQRKSLRH